MMRSVVVLALALLLVFVKGNFEFRAQEQVAFPLFANDIPPNLVAAASRPNDPYVYAISDFPARVYRANLATLNNVSLAQGAYFNGSVLNMAVLNQVNGLNVLFFEDGVSQIPNNYNHLFAAGFGFIYPVDLSQTVPFTASSYLPPQAVVLPTSFQPVTVQTWFDTATNLTNAWFAMGDSPTTIALVTLSFANLLLPTPVNATVVSNSSVGNSWPSKIIVGSVKVSSTLMLLVDTAGNVWPLDMNKHRPDLVLRGLSSSFIPASNQSAPSVAIQAVAYYNGILYACGTDWNGLTRVWAVNVSNATYAGGVLPIVSTNTTGGVGDTCKVISLDTVGGQAFIGSNDAEQGRVVRYDMLRNTIVEVDYVSGTGQELSDVPIAFFFDDPDRIVNMVSQSDVISIFASTTCPNDCTTPNGQCMFGQCACNISFAPPDCSQRACATNCSYPWGGVCEAGGCFCNANHTGFNCETLQCPNNCSGHGSCSGPPLYNCTCTGLYISADCSQVRLAQCDEIYDQQTCVNRQNECGWCASAKNTTEDPVCRKGNIVGPVQGSCVLWYTDYPESVGIIVFAIIFLVVVFILILINIITAVLADFHALTSTKAELAQNARAEWWRDERSTYAWHLYEQLQFIVLYIMMSTNFDTRLISFTRTMNFVAFAIPIPGFFNNMTYPTRDPVLYPQDNMKRSLLAVSNGRTLLSYDQYGNSIDGDAQQVFYATVLWWGIAVAVFTIAALIAMLIIGFIKSNMDVFLARVVRVLVRMLILGYFPVVLVACAHSKAGYGLTTIASVLAFIIVGVGVPVFGFLTVHKKTKELFMRLYRSKFGPFFGTYHHKHADFVIFAFGRRFLLALFLGFFAFPYAEKYYIWPQGVLAILVMVAYAIYVVIRKPYLDVAHVYFECGICIINCLTIVTAWINYNESVSTGIATEIIFAILQIISLAVCTGLYIHAWLVGSNIHNCKQCCSCGRQ